MCNRCGCQNWMNEERNCAESISNCERGVNARSVKRLLCEAERILEEENHSRRNCEHRCACQYRNCVRRCNWDD